MAVMSDKGKPADAAVEYMAKFSGATVPEFRAQLATTAMFYKAADAAAFAAGQDVKKTMEQIRSFTFSKGLFGKGAKSKDFVGIAFPDGTVLGNKGNVKLRDWFMPLSCADKTLREVSASLREIGLKQGDIPYLVRFVENPQFDLPLVDIFHGATSLETHDYLHVILGRGLLPKDEAFVIGFSMGSTGKVSTTEE